MSNSVYGYGYSYKDVQQALQQLARAYYRISEQTILNISGMSKIIHGEPSMTMKAAEDTGILGGSEIPTFAPMTPPNATANNDVHEMSHHIRSIMGIMGLNTLDPSLQDTPKRIAKAWASFNQPFDPAALLRAGFQTDASSECIVAQSGIQFEALCEHHFFPFMGKAFVAYLPNKGRVVGLSKVVRLVHAVGHERPTLQESATARIANIIMDVLDPKGVFVAIKAEHTCVACRGVNTPGVDTFTSVVKGIFRDSPQAKQEVLQLMSSM